MKSTLVRKISRAALSILLYVVLAPHASAVVEQTLHTFDASAANPTTNLVFDAQGNLYGATGNGGNQTCNFGCGVVFRLSARSGYKVIYQFTGGADGGYPEGSLVFDAAGDLYGVTAWGYGTIFKLSPQPDGTWTQTTIHAFSGVPDGSTPYSGLTMDAAGNLYGTTRVGGASGVGCVYQLTPQPDGTWKESVIHSFYGPDGEYPWAEVSVASNGTVYGTTIWGGAYQHGTVFSLTPNGGSWKESVLFSFKGGKNHGEPAGNVVLDSFGNLIGTASDNGESYPGCVYKLTPNPDGTWTGTTIHTFAKAGDGSFPEGNLIRDRLGDLYGTTYVGGAGYGTIFRLQSLPGGAWTYALVYDFDYKDGASPTLGNSVNFDRYNRLFMATVYGGIKAGYDGYGVALALAIR